MNREVNTFHSGRYLFSAERGTDQSVLNEAVNVFCRMPLLPEVLDSFNSPTLESAVFNEAKLEGNSVTFDQVREIIKHNRDNFTQNDSALETVNIAVANRLVDKKQGEELSAQMIANIHSELIQGLSNIKDTPGSYRTGGGKADAEFINTEYTPPASTLDINFLIKNLLEWLDIDLKDENPVFKAILLHLHLKKIQPYINANGHTARLAEIWYMKKQGIRLLPHLLIELYNSNKEEYYRHISEFYITSSAAGFIDFVCESVKETVYELRDKNFLLMKDLISTHKLAKLLENKTIIQRQHDLLSILKEEGISFQQEDLQLKKPFTNLYGKVSRTTVARDIKKFEDLKLIKMTTEGYIYNHE